MWARSVFQGPENYISPTWYATKAETGKCAIDLDSWVCPDWNNIPLAMACGFPSEHKSKDESYVIAELAEVIAEPASKLSPDRESFLLASSLEEDCNVYFSGMSGGPIYAEHPDTKELTIVGIVYEGIPGSSEYWNNRGEEAFLTKKDIQVRGVTFTPDIFEKWLKQVCFLA